MASDASDVVPIARAPSVLARMGGAFGRAFDSDLAWSFRRDRVAVVASILLLAIVLTALFAPFIAPQNPYDLSQLFVDKAELPPIWRADGEWPFLLGTDPQGRDILSTILYGSRVSLLIGVCSVLIAASVGIAVGLIAGYFGGRTEALLMRVGDVVLSIPTLLVAILVSALMRQALPPGLRESFSAGILVMSIALTGWVQYARLVRAATLVERRKDYVQAAELMGIGAMRIIFRHVLPNTLTPVLVAATLNLGLAILAEATLSFLGVGMPPTQPSLGTLVRIGQQYLFSGSWWIVVFPCMQLALIVLSVNLLGDWLRDALNPKLR